MGTRLYVKDSEGKSLLDGGAFDYNIFEMLRKVKITNEEKEKCEYAGTERCLRCDCSDSEVFNLTFEEYLETLKEFPGIIKDNNNVSVCFCTLKETCQKDDWDVCFNCEELIKNHLVLIKIEIS